MTEFNDEGVPFDGRAALRQGYSPENNPYPGGELAGVKWLSDWWTENYECFRSHVHGHEKPDTMAEFPETRTVKWIDDRTGKTIGICEYVRKDLTPAEQCFSVKEGYAVKAAKKFYARPHRNCHLTEALTIRSAEEVRREAQWGAYNKVLHWINEQDVKQLAKGDLYDAVMDMRPDDAPAPSTDDGIPRTGEEQDDLLWRQGRGDPSAFEMPPSTDKAPSVTEAAKVLVEARSPDGLTVLPNHVLILLRVLAAQTGGR